jgi:hypothetical protein
MQWDRITPHDIHNVAASPRIGLAAARAHVIDDGGASSEGKHRSECQQYNRCTTQLDGFSRRGLWPLSRSLRR